MYGFAALTGSRVVDLSRLGWNEGDLAPHRGEVAERELSGEIPITRVRKIEDHFDEHRFSDDELDHHLDHHQLLGGAHKIVVGNYKDHSQELNSPLRRRATMNQYGYPDRHLSSRVGNTIHVHSGLHDLAHPEEKATRRNYLMKSYAALDHVTSSPVPKSLFVFRGASPSARIHRLAPGSLVKDAGYTGTSPSPRIASDFATNEYHADHPNKDLHYKYMAKIHVPAGTYGHLLDVNSLHTHSKENELLLHRGTVFRIDGHERVHTTHTKFGSSTFEKPQKFHVVHMTVVGQHPNELKEGSR